MFIYTVWDQFCQEISSNYKTIRIDEVLDYPKESNWIAIKHDVETNVSKALELAKIENKYNIRATYFVQADLLDEHYDLLQKIQSLGHEVTYHYDVLDSNNGDMEKSIEDFKNNVLKFNQYGFEVQTVCPHGNPVIIREGWSSNKDFFRDQNVQTLFPNILDMVVALPNRLDYSYTYISDAGYGWKEIVNIDTNDIKNDGDKKIKNHQELLNIINSKEHIIISTHPHRWESSSIRFILNVYIFKLLRVIARTLSKIPLFKNIISRYYYLAKKI